MNHRQQVGAVGDQRGGVVEGDAADHADRQMDAVVRLLQQGDVGGGCARLGHRVEEAAEGDVAGAFTGGLLGQVNLRVAGGTDDGVAPEQGSRRGQRPVGLTQVDADAQARGQLGVIVDDQLSVVACTQLGQGLRFAQPAGLVLALVTVLQQGHAAFEGRFDIGQKLAGQQLAVSDGIQAA
ncbi:hypothetical protein D3C81_1546350 [compost metagenome]